ncbi:hypothetical protein K449DRAFT_106499 [Hypoxylon sp. EC38]|nr:hypothetical protein K449DRAFT_106499 [Hypoxylon sp. EC38]
MYVYVRLCTPMYALRLLCLLFYYFLPPGPVGHTFPVVIGRLTVSQVGTANSLAA